MSNQPPRMPYVPPGLEFVFETVSPDPSGVPVPIATNQPVPNVVGSQMLNTLHANAQVMRDNQANFWSMLTELAQVPIGPTTFPAIRFVPSVFTAGENMDDDVEDITRRLQELTFNRGLGIDKKRRVTEAFKASLKERGWHTDNPDEPESCAICFEQGRYACELPCGHAYHRDCIMPWFDENATCPVCRKEFEYEEQESRPQEAPEETRAEEEPEQDDGEMFPSLRGYGGVPLNVRLGPNIRSLRNLIESAIEREEEEAEMAEQEAILASIMAISATQQEDRGDGGGEMDELD